VGFSGPLSDRVEIRELYETYLDAVVRNDAELWASTWAEDCVWDMAGQRAEGRESTGTLWKELMAGFSRVIFSGFIGAISVEGANASGRYHALEEVWLKTGGAQRLQGRYADELVRRDNRWLFKSRVYTIVDQIPVAVLPAE
jgi:uncharacterized protein (TIGR02246 family)